MNLSVIIILFISVIATGIITDIFNNKIKDFNKYFIPLSVSFVLSLIILHILPELFSEENNSKIGLYILLGFILQIIFELLSKGVEHGHIHYSNKHKSSNIVLSIMLGLSIHSFIEGMPLGLIEDVAHSHNHHTHNHLTDKTSSIYLWMIIAHKIPVAMILMSFFIKYITNKKLTYLLFGIFAITAPLGLIIGSYMKNEISDVSSMFLAISTGMLLHITTLLIFEDHHNKNKIFNILLIILGFILGIGFYGNF